MWGLCPYCPVNPTFPSHGCAMICPMYRGLILSPSNLSPIYVRWDLGALVLLGGSEPISLPLPPCAQDLGMPCSSGRAAEKRHAGGMHQEHTADTGRGTENGQACCVSHALQRAGGGTRTPPDMHGTCLPGVVSGYLHLLEVFSSS